MGRGCSEFTRLSGARRSDPSLNVAPKLSLGNSGTEPNISAASMQTTNSCPAAVKTANKLLNCSQQQQQQLLPLTLRDDTTTTKGKGEEEDEVPLNLSENTNNKVVNGFCGDGSVNELSSTTTSDAERQQLIGGVSPTSTSPGGETIFL
jgi:hypothetical protein